MTSGMAAPDLWRPAMQRDFRFSATTSGRSQAHRHKCPASRSKQRRAARCQAVLAQDPKSDTSSMQAGHRPAQPAKSVAVAVSRRAASLGMAAAAAAVVLPSSPLAVLGALWQCPPARADAGGSSGGGGDLSFYSEWPYVQPIDILPYLRATAKQGDPDSVLEAIDTFASYYPMYRSGPQKGKVLEELVRNESPSVVIELGTFVGYGTVRIARALPPGGRVITVEAGEQQAQVAREVLTLAGLNDPQRVQVVVGLSSEVLPKIASSLALPEERQETNTSSPSSPSPSSSFSSSNGPSQPAGLVFLDHCKPCYLPDLQAMESLGLVGAGSLVLADNVLVPGTPEYLAHVQVPGSLPQPDPAEAAPGSRRGRWRGGSASSSAATVLPRLRYNTQLVGADYEVEQRYKEGWAGPQRDAMAVSRCTGPIPQEQQQQQEK